jgi:hypothetical protein
VTRRAFLQSAALAGTAALGAPGFVRARWPSEKLNIAIIGCGGRGASNMHAMLGENIVALCDVDADNLGKAAQQAPHAKQFRDFRKLYDELKDSEFDAVGRRRPTRFAERSRNERRSAWLHQGPVGP